MLGLKDLKKLMMTVPPIPIVDKNDVIIDHAEKLAVHQQSLMHRAYSILVFNAKNQLLIHQRTNHKYHSGGLWTNTCCGHPNQNESMEAAVHRRLGEEMGFDCELNFLYKFHYIAYFENGLTENEIDHVYIGYYDGDFDVNPEEVADYEWVDIDFVMKDAKQNPAKYTFWFKEILKSEAFEKFIKTKKMG